MRVQILVLTCALAGAVAATAQNPPAAAPPQGPITLEQAVELGRIRGVEAALARAGERIAETRVGQRRADILPAINASATYTRQTLNLDEFGIASFSGLTDPFGIYNLRIGASQSIVNPAAWARIRAARDSVIAAGDDARNAGAVSGAVAGVAWLRLYSAEETVKAREADSTVASDLLEQARRSLEAGVSAAIDLTRSGVNFGSIRSQLAIARNARDRARLDLIRALDLPPSRPIAIAPSEELTALPLVDNADSAVAYALIHRPDLAAERQRLAVLNQGRKAIRAEYLPSLGANGYWQTSGPKIPDVRGTWQVQVGFTIPILDGLRRQTRSAEQGIRIEAQEIRLRDLRNQVEADARIAALDLASAREQVALATDRERLAVEELRQAGERFAAGVAGSLETSNAQLNLTAARDALIQARVAYGVARVGAQRALGLIASSNETPRNAP